MFKKLLSQKSDSSRAESASWLLKVVSFSAWLQVKLQPLARQFDWLLIRTCLFILGLSFVIASSVSTFAANYAMTFSAKGKSGKPGTEENAEVPMAGVSSGSGNSGPSGGELKRFILNRNLFNSQGVLPPEPEDQANGLKKTKGLDFDAVPCKEETQFLQAILWTAL
jgi:hypothetical protein